MINVETLIDKIKHEQGQFDAESIYFLNLSGQSRMSLFFFYLFDA